MYHTSPARSQRRFHHAPQGPRRSTALARGRPPGPRASSVTKRRQLALYPPRARTRAAPAARSRGITCVFAAQQEARSEVLNTAKQHLCRHRQPTPVQTVALCRHAAFVGWARRHAIQPAGAAELLRTSIRGPATAPQRALEADVLPEWSAGHLARSGTCVGRGCNDRASRQCDGQSVGCKANLPAGATCHGQRLRERGHTRKRSARCAGSGTGPGPGPAKVRA
jgi:hypothetical protein